MNNGQTTPPLWNVALMQAQDPQSAQLAQLMHALGQQPLTSPGQLGANLLADALLQYGYNRRRQALQAAAASPTPADTSGDIRDNHLFTNADLQQS